MKIQQSYFSRVDNPLWGKGKENALIREVCLLMHGNKALKPAFSIPTQQQFCFGENV